jgi:large subunit ribosomal protein L6
MSRIGRLPIEIPQGVKISVDEQNKVSVEGPKGKLSCDVQPTITVEIKDGKVELSRSSDDLKIRGYHGLYRQLINNMIVGVTKGYSKTLVINGVGYRAEAKGKSILFTLGYATQIEFMLPEGITAKCDTPTKVTITGIDKQRIGQTAAEIRSLRGPEPYKGKGIKYETEVIRRKAGKTAAAKK